ncbi:PhzF family phenazine biosynthesis protein [Pseudothauera nasutitermitis]|uniref:PhzF family phenazine biosynthesis protein n=1 Tax=Pseudothauera nasutitermitis TaxID=2565930 RepID=A0A4S4AXS2_9RHOO|nr:PhzF family phenazine biosynthesis protein [Pseudothauera nasutitermitis]THF64923.1 PhzF family phenazine biosynthesis protein [Pseudothauera nasutitermitis]
MKVPFKQVDVFTGVPFGGNPVAVVLDAQGLDAAQMQRIANWTNLSETTFVLPPTHTDADYRVRIFTPRAELPFAGHPTLGTAHALLEAGRIAARNGRLTQECAAGLIALTVSAADGGGVQIAFDLPSPGYAPLGAGQIDELEDILGAPLLRAHPPQFINVGPTWTTVQLADAATVLSLAPDMARLAAFDLRTKSTGVVVFGAHAQGADAAMEVRAFAPSQGVNEDPVCGSGNGAVAAFVREAGLVAAFGARYVSSQGAAVGRSGRLSIGIEAGGAIRVGGQSVTCIDGSIVC